VRGLVRAAAYLPASSQDGRRVAGPDEDAFTLLATALERVRDPADASPRSATQIEVVGRLPTTLDWALEELCGSVGPPHLFGEGGPALLAALAAAEEGSGEEVVVLAAELPERSEPALATPPRPGAGAVAFRFCEGAGPGLEETVDRIRAEPSTLGTAFALQRALTSGKLESWVGDWEVDPDLGRPIDPRRTARRVEREANAVSEGAYVPRPRYLESLPTRWRFIGQRCPRCSAVTFPARGACRRCGTRTGLVEVALARNGALVVATTVIGKGGQPTEFDPQVEVDGPYEVVLAEIAPGVRVTLQLADADAGQVRIGDRIDTQLRRLYPMEGEWRYGRKAVPALKA